MPRRIRVQFKGKYKLQASPGTFNWTGNPSVLTYNSGGSTSTSADFETRRNSPGVFRSFDFTTLGSLVSSSDWIVPGRYGYTPGTSTQATIETSPLINTVVGSSMRFDIPSQSGGNAAGTWQAQFSTDDSVHMGGNSRFFIQWRQRFSQSFINTFIQDGSGGAQAGIKQCIIDSALSPDSHSQTHLVPTSYNQYRFTDVEIGEVNYVARLPITGDVDLQPGGDNAGMCLRSTAIAQGNGTLVPGCINWHADEWMTFQLEAKLGAIIVKQVITPEGTNLGNIYCFADSELRLWVAREGQPSVLTLDWTPTKAGSHYAEVQCDPDYPHFSRIYFLPYMTGKSTTQVHPTLTTWYSELILSTQKIPDPAVFPSWRSGKTKDTIYPINGTAYMSNISLPAPSNESPPFNGLIDAWCGFAQDEAVLYSSLGGGHQTGQPDAEWQNAVIKIDLKQNDPTWAIVDRGSDYSQAYITQRYLDGRPCSRHHNFAIAFIKGTHTYDGKDRIFHPECQFAWAEGSQAGWPGYPLPPYSAGADVESFRIADAGNPASGYGWDSIDWWNDSPGWLNGTPLAVSVDHRDGKLYTARGGQCWILDASVIHGSWTTLTPTGMADWGWTATAIDTKNNQLVGLLPSRQTNALYANSPRLQRMSLSDYTITNTLLQNYVGFAANLAINAFDGAGFVYDPDNDRFLVIRPNDDGNSSVDPPIMAIAQDGTCTELPNAVVQKCRSTSQPGKRLIYVPSLKCIVYVSRFANDMQFMPTV